jgi:AbrB family looped-hinge helix DNA binding protein
MESVLTIKCRVTIPKTIRDHMNLKPGGQIKFFVHPDGTVIILPKIPTSALRGMVSSRRRLHASPATLDKMHQAAATCAARGLKRGKS